jgi:hypothetical protein
MSLSSLLKSNPFEKEFHLKGIEAFVLCDSGFKSIICPSGVNYFDGFAFPGLYRRSISVANLSRQFRICDSLLDAISGESIIRDFGKSNTMAIACVVFFCSESLFRPAMDFNR